MASFTPTDQPDPIEIDTFLGLNESVGETEIKLGEAIVQENFRVTNNYKIKKRDGHNTFVDFGVLYDVQGLWYGTLDSKEIFVFCNNGTVYEYDMTAETTFTAIADLITEGTVSVVGTITDAKTKIFYFQSKVYFLNGTDYKEYDGTTYQDVVPYVPTIYINAPPTGGGTAFEELNLLTGQKIQTFISDGTGTFTLVESDIDSVDEVKVNEVVTSAYTTDLVNGQITFTGGSEPAVEDEVSIEWTNNDTKDEDMVKNNRFAMKFGPGNDTTVFIWGNSKHKNRRLRCYPLKAEYFPANYFTDIGTDDYGITDIVGQYDRQIIFKENQSYYSYSSYNETTLVYDYPVFDLNEKVGNLAEDGVQVVENNPISYSGSSVWDWTNTQINDERNASIISDKVKESLGEQDLSSAVTFDYQKQKELWTNIGSIVWVWNYGNDTWYKYTNINATGFINIQGEVYYGSNGTIEKFESDLYGDNGDKIETILELGFTGFGIEYLTKVSRELWVTIEPATRTDVCIKYETNKKSRDTVECKEIEYRTFSYGDVDYGQFSYGTNRRIEPQRVKIRAKKYAYIKFIFESDNNDKPLTILSLVVLAESQGKVR